MDCLDSRSQIECIHLNDIVAESVSAFRSTQSNDTLSASPAYTTQPPALVELRVLSQPNAPEYTIDRYADCVYRSDVNRETFIYAEMGINKHHVNFRQTRIE